MRAAGTWEDGGWCCSRSWMPMIWRQGMRWEGRGWEGGFGWRGLGRRLGLGHGLGGWDAGGAGGFACGRRSLPGCNLGVQGAQDLPSQLALHGLAQPLPDAGAQVDNLRDACDFQAVLSDYHSHAQLSLSMRLIQYKAVTSSFSCTPVPLNMMSVS